MSQRDALATFAKAQAITASAKSDIIDLKAAIRDIAVGTPLYLVCSVDVAFTDAASDSTVTVALETDDLEAMGSPVIRQTFGIFPALSAIGKILNDTPLFIQPNVLIEKFCRLDFTVTGGNLSTGSITAYITDTPQLVRTYARSGGPVF